MSEQNEQTAPTVKIGVQYSCDECGIDEAEVMVPAREAEQDVKDWMDRTIVHLAIDHDSRSPRCHPQSLSRVKIPMPAGTVSVGGPVEN